MSAQAALSPTGRPSQNVPYPASWVDHLTHAIEGLPIPAWACYALLLVGAVLFVNGIAWIGGQYPPGTFDPLQSGYAVYGVYALALVHYLNGVADSRIAAFRPALDVDAQEYGRLRYELTTLPAKQGALAGFAGLGLVAFLYGWDVLTVGATGSPAFLVGRFLIEGFTFAAAAVLIYHTIHQLRLVNRTIGLASNIDLFEPVPLYAFSDLTARTGIGLVLITAYSFLLGTSTNAFGVGLSALVAVVATATFVLPLEGMHRRLAAEKDRLQLELGRRLKATLGELHQSIDERDLSVSDALNKTLGSLQLERDAIARMSIWPWQPATLRGFGSALLVPIVIWLMIRVLEQFV